MTALKARCDIRSYEKSTHLLVYSAAKKINLTGIQANFSCTPFFMMYYDSIPESTASMLLEQLQILFGYGQTDPPSLQPHFADRGAPGP
jgi:hypothetical protein